MGLMPVNGTEAKAWSDDNQFYLLIVDTDKNFLQIDLGEPGWMTTHADWMRRPGYWLLNYKSQPVTALVVKVNLGDQPYYTARHVGLAGSGGSNEIVAYGIGKKQANGEMVRLWVMPGGSVVGGDDVDAFGVDIVKAMGPR